MAERVRVLLSEKDVDARIQQIGEQISKDYAGKSVHLVCVLKGGSFFMCELAKRDYRAGFSGLYVSFQLWK